MATAKFGTNLSGMEWAAPNLRYGSSSYPNMNYTVPRAADVSYLAGTGMTMSRLPIQWELLQPIRVSSPANSAVRTLTVASDNAGTFSKTTLTTRATAFWGASTSPWPVRETRARPS